MNKKPIYYKQSDPRWGKIPYTIDGDINETIGASGCGPTSMAMILATWVDSKITPIDTCRLALELKDRTANNGTEWEYFGHVANKYKLKFVQTNDINTAIKAMRAGAYIICSMGKGIFTKHGHFIVLWNYDGKVISVSDPASISKSRTTYDPSVFKAQCKQYFIFNK